MDVKQNIRKCREDRGFSQESVAAALGISQQAYQQMESGPTKIDAELMPRLAEILETTVGKLYGEEADTQQTQSLESAVKELLHKLIETKDKVISTQDKVIEVQDRMLGNGGRRK